MRRCSRIPTAHTWVRITAAGRQALADEIASLKAMSFRIDGGSL